MQTESLAHSKPQPKNLGAQLKERLRARKEAARLAKLSADSGTAAPQQNHRDEVEAAPNANSRVEFHSTKSSTLAARLTATKRETYSRALDHAPDLPQDLKAGLQDLLS